MSYELLSYEIKKYIREQGWSELRPIQNAAISRILGSDDNFILASKTASGKTEAAFLPIISKLNFSDNGVLVLYVSPLIALINDQFYRIEKLCEELDIKLTKWHGEANVSQKKNLVKEPRGILMITPESLEAMFVNKPYYVINLFFNLKYIVIDEIHSFIGTDRGIQLKSIISRLRIVNKVHFSIIGLSATIGNYLEAKKFTGEPDKTKVLLDKSHKEIAVIFKFFKETGNELPLGLLKSIYKETVNKRVLIFPNTRGRVEEVAVKLKKLSIRLHGHGNYFAHHSAIDKDTREHIESFAKNSKREYFCISCTSTLELGIDIGGIDEVVQIDATSSIASLIQRVGRSGREDDKSCNLYLGATREWSLIQSIACWLLYNDGFIEPPEICTKAYDILVHQALSIIKGKSGVEFDSLIAILANNSAFCEIDQSEIKEICRHLVNGGILEMVRNELIIGIDGEFIVNTKEFYSVFQNEDNFTIIHNGVKIGELPLSPQIVLDANILLSARIWKIKEIEFKAKKVYVIPALDGKKPVFFGEAGLIDKRIFEAMMSILFSKRLYEFLDNTCLEELKIMRGLFNGFSRVLTSSERPLIVKGDKFYLYTFTGTKINRTLELLFNCLDLNYIFHSDASCFEIIKDYKEFLGKWSLLLEKLDNLDDDIIKLLKVNPSCINFSKWGNLLPEKYQVLIMKEKYYDIKSTVEFLQCTTIVVNESDS